MINVKVMAEIGKACTPLKVMINTKYVVHSNHLNLRDKPQIHNIFKGTSNATINI